MNTVTDLPSELLARILRFASHPEPSPSLPPDEYEPPWQFGQVCSRWRRISRSLPELWGSTEISLDHGQDISNLRCAAATLPEVAKVSLQVSDAVTNIPAKSMKTLASLLSCVTELEWDMERARKGAMIDFPPNSLSRLVKLTLHLPRDNSAEGYENLFGTSSRLQQLKLESASPTFLINSNVPWSQLRSLEFSVGSESAYLGAYTCDAWAQLAQTNPFSTMTSLRELTIDLCENKLYGIIIPLDFPWQQLKTVRIFLRARTRPSTDLLGLLSALKKCTAIEHLWMEIDMPPMKGSPDVVFHFPALQSLSLEGPFTLPMVNSLTASGTVRSLDLQTVGLSLPEFYSLMKHCPNLTEVDSTITGGQTSSTTDVVMPQIELLVLHVQNHSSFPDLLITRSLTTLKLFVRCPIGALNATLRLIERSGANIKDYQCEQVRIVSQSIRPQEDTLRSLLSLLKSCTSFSIVGFIAEDFYEEISTMAVLPRLNNLRLNAANGDAYLDMLKRRFKLEQETVGQIVLKSGGVVYVPLTIDEFAGMNRALQELEKEFGVELELILPSVSGFLLYTHTNFLKT
ncbi:hypothetical protein H0H92_010184 [Tricholoma furcatifolium]|nr:hypothetical protein H0H92_010184 [Tricholoma furcatifolium]